ncbi:methyl-accepting chemotaxis protein [Paenibacillus sp.]|uniref:methyl-accepting chemotaxis protein n=1 Tax=Paenibacillus sp. TaxID=58172 RepID=UPI002D55422E|nr:methyl-accepting chemotaxis protein [Paenibacillus sp.]HZG88434.1 methyl-accepting chemotaxis protein [Paenibacillus sp.]
MKSIQARILLFFSLLIFIVSVVLSYALYQSSTSLLMHSIGHQAKAIAERAAAGIDPVRYEALTADSDYYKELRLQLNDMKEANGLKYLYTMGVRDNGGAPEYFYVVDGAPLDASGDDVSAFGDVETETFHSLGDVFATGIASTGELTYTELYGATLTAYVPITSPDGRVVGVVGADFDATNIYHLMRQNLRTVLLVIGIVLAVSLAAAWLFTRFLLGPLRRLTGAIRHMQSGDLTVRVDTRGKDEIGMLSRAFQQMVDELSTMIRGMRDNAAALGEASHSLTSDASASEASGQRVAAGLREVAAGAETQVQRAAETATAMEEVNAGIQRIAEASLAASEASWNSTASARRGKERADQALRQMHAISETTQALAADIETLERRSAEIRHIAAMISGIASQTNLLALNAAIEAARAGEHGRGFAVVAEQVRKLAAQTEESAQLVGARIGETTADMSRVAASIRAGASEAEAGMDAVRETDAAFADILAEVERIADQIQEISAISQQAAAGAEEVGASVDEMAGISREAASHFRTISASSEAQLSATERTARAAAALQEMAEALADGIRKFKV